MPGYTKIQLRRGTEVNWTATNPILSLGEVGIEIDTHMLKVGDGINAWLDLSYYGGTVSSVNTQTGDVVLDTGNIDSVTDKRYTTDAQLAILNELPDVLNRITNMESTGLIKGGVISINVDDTKFNLAEGWGMFIDNYTDELNPVRTALHWSAMTAVIDPLLATADNTYIAMDSTGSLVFFDDEISREQTRDLIHIGWTDHTDRAHITMVGTEPAYHIDTQVQLGDLMHTLGVFNIDGNDYGPGTGLALTRSAGNTWSVHSNYVNDRKNPNVVSTLLEDPVSFVYYYRDGTGGWVNDGPQVLFVDPNHWDDGSGVLADVSVGHWTIQLLSLYAQTISNDVQYGQQEYNSLEEAKSAIKAQIEISPYNLYNTLRGWLIVKQGATDLSDPLHALFIGSGSLNLQDVLSGSPIGEVNTLANVGLTGQGLFLNKDGVVLNLKNITPASSKVTVANDVPNQALNIDIVEGNITHQSLSGAGTNTHGNIDLALTRLVNTSGTNTGDQDILKYNYALATGIITRGIISINVGDGTKIDITAGSSLYVDNSNPLIPVIDVLVWGVQTGLTPPSLDVNGRLWIGIQRTAPGVGTIVYSTEFSAHQKRTIAILGRVWGNGTTTIEGVGQYATPAWGYEKTLEDLLGTLGSLNRDGNIFTPDAALTVSKSSGSSFRFSGGSGLDIDSPNILSDATQNNIASYHYHIAQGSGFTTLTTTIDPEYYDVAGVKTVVPSGKFTIQRVYYFPRSGVVDVVYGQAYYNSLAEAVSNVSLEAVVVNNDNARSLLGSILRSWVCVQQGTTDLSDPLKARLITALGFGAGGASGGGAGGVDSVNGMTGVVVLDADSISDTLTTHKFTTAGDISKLAGIEAGAVADHVNIANRGTNTHSQIDSHISSTSNPHGVTKTQVSLGNVTDDAQLKREAGDINSFTVKGTPSGADIALIEDSAGAFAKAKVTLSSIVGLGVSSFNTRIGAVAPSTNDYTWSQINKTTSSLADITTRNHSDLQNKNLETDIKHVTDNQANALTAAASPTTANYVVTKNDVVSAYVASEGTSSGAATLTDKITLPFTPSVTGNYLLSWSCEVATNNNAGKVEVRVWDGTTTYNQALVFPGVANQWGFGNGMIQLALTGGVAKTFALQYNTYANTPSIRRARLRIERDI